MIAAFTDMQHYPAFRANTVATCATARSFETGANYQYLLRKFGIVTAEARAATYASIDLDLIATTMHSGVRFEEDNANLYRAIATAVGEGKLGTFIDAFRETADGRGAYLALTNACYSPSLAVSRAETCKQVLRNLTWGVGTDLEAYIQATLNQHNLIAENTDEQSPFTDRDKALFFRRGLSTNERYRSVVIAMPATTSYEAACEAIRTVVMHDTELNHNGRAADNRAINRTGNAANAPNTARRSASNRPARAAPSAPSRRSGAGTVKGYKLPKSGIQLHNGEYSPEDIKLLREHGEYEEMRAFRTQNNVRRNTNAVATSNRQDGDVASQAGHSVRSLGSRSHLSGDTASLRSNDRGNAMIMTGRPRMVAVPGAHMSPTHRNIDNSPSWMRDPKFVSEVHATKSRQFTNGLSLGPRWEAPTHRVIKAVTQAVVLAPVKMSNPPAKPPVRKPAAVAKAPMPPPKPTPVIENLVGYSSSEDSSDDGLPKAWGPILFPGVLAPPPDPVNVAVAVATTTAAANTVAPTAPTNAAVAGDARSHTTYSIFGTDTEDDDSVKGKHHAAISAKLAKLDPKVPCTITATARKRKAAADSSDDNSSVASCNKKPAAKKKPLVKTRTAPTRKRAAPVKYKPTVVRKSSSSDGTKKTSNKKA
jgi:hypothetical protein